MFFYCFVWIHPIPCIKWVWLLITVNGFRGRIFSNIIAILLPPLAVGLKAGVGGSLILNIILTLLFYLPGPLHALYVVLN